MHEKSLTRTAAPLTLLEQLDARVKIVCALSWAICVVTIRRTDLPLVATYAALLAALLVSQRRSVGQCLRRFATALPAIAMLVVLLPFFKEGTVLWQLGPLEVTREGLYAAQRLATCAALCVGVLALVWVTTPEAELIAGLRRLGFMLRYLHVLRPELHRLWDARAARTIGRRRPPFRSATNLLGALALRAHGRAERVADAMAARGYAGQWPVSHAHDPPARATLAAVLFVSVVVLLRILL
jgi:energy-coupling factor transporter transmembrane protein EcfT